MRSEGSVSPIRGGPTESELLRIEEEISRRLALVEMRPAGTARLPTESKLVVGGVPAIEAVPVLVAPVAPPPQVRRSRRLIGGAAVVVAAGLAFSSYYAWHVQTESPPRVPPQPATQALVPAPAETPPAPVAAPAARFAAPPVAAPAPARATVPTRPATAMAPAAEPAVQPAPRTTTSRTSPPVVTVAAPSGPRPAAVTHTRRDEPAAQAAAAPAATVPAAAVPPAAAPRDCADAVVALGLCASQAREALK
jgi:hypothetical protein